MGVRSRKSLIEQAQDVVLDVAEQIQPHIEAAVDKGKEVAGGAAASLASTLEETRDAAEKKAADVEKQAEKKSRAVRKDARKQSKAAKKSVEKSARRQAAAVGATATAVAAAVKNHGEEPKKKGGGFRKLLLLGALAGVAGFLYKKFAGGGAPAPSTAPYTPPTSPATRATPAAPAAPVAEENDVPGADHPLIPESLDDIPGAHRAASEDAAQGAAQDTAQAADEAATTASGDAQSDPLLASDEPAPFKPGKTGDALD